ncbi:MAG: DUF3501 family protein [Pseudomonadota bacterium]|jgi:hypothetical protein|nr:DUF3501 family protein [Alphaproteobacteria bacterium]
MLTSADILSISEFERVRSIKRKEILQLKENRRLAVGPDITFYFENVQTIWWQIQEMLRIENGGEEQVADELGAYNPLIPVRQEKGYELSATMMIEIDDSVRRKVVLNQLFGIDQHIMFELQNATIPAASIDPSEERNRAEDHKTLAVHFLKWLVPTNLVGSFLSEDVHLTINHPYYSFKSLLSQSLKESLKKDLEIMS